MARMFTPKLPAASQPRQFQNASQVEFFFKDTLKFHTVVVVGACLQLVLCAVLPVRWAAVPAVILLLSSIVTTIMQTLSPATNVYMDGVVPGRASAQIPSEKGTFGPEPADQGMVVFHLGAQWNHPLGAFCPGAPEIGARFRAMAADLENRREELGLLGMSDWRASERGSNNSFNVAYYFKDVESVHKFAHGEIHRGAWDWYNSEKPAHIGVYHETFIVPPGGHETMYVNCRPVLLGRGMAKCETGEGEGDGQWVNTLVSADTPALKTQYARLGRDERGVPKY